MEGDPANRYLGQEGGFLVEGENFGEERAAVALEKGIYDGLSDALEHGSALFVLLDARGAVAVPGEALDVPIDRVHKGTDDLNKKFEDRQAVVVGPGHLHALLNKPLLHQVLVERKRPYVVGRGVVCKYSDTPQQVYCEILVRGLVACDSCPYQEGQEGHEGADVDHLNSKIFVET